VEKSTHPSPPLQAGGQAVVFPLDGDAENKSPGTFPFRGFCFSCLVDGLPLSVVPHVLQSFLDMQLLFLHRSESHVVNREDADFRIVHFAVELLVALVEPTKLGIGFHQGFDNVTLLIFEHDPTSWR
jgi:hypothetical protein